MKTQEELEQLKQEYKELNCLKELTEEELEEVTGGYRKDIGSDKNAKVIFDL